MSINSKLVTFAQQELVIARNEAERERIRTSLSHLEKVIKDKLGNEVKEFIRFGSFTRNTILPRYYDPLSDVDLMVVFDTSSGRLAPNTYRKKLHDVVKAAYPNSISEKDFPAVRLVLNHIMFDLVPAYTERGFWTTDIRYYIPDRSSNWQRTEPKDIDGPLATANQNVGNNALRNAIRLCKHWNAQVGYPLESYLMEKQIVNGYYSIGSDTYSVFLTALERCAGHRPGVLQALNSIRTYKGNWNTPANPEKELQWVKKLLPGLN
jgi:predicted nucleotidyltransferase